MRHVVIEYANNSLVKLPRAAQGEHVLRVQFEPDELATRRIAYNVARQFRGATIAERHNRPDEYRVFKKVGNLTFATVRFSRPDEE